MEFLQEAWMKNGAFSYLATPTILLVAGRRWCLRIIRLTTSSLSNSIELVIK
jgi:hypothetical protein